MNIRIIGSLTLIVLVASFAMADIRLPAVISDNMVIQADTNVPIWGWANPNETVTITIGKQKQTATSGTNGKWMVKLEAMQPSAIPVEMTVMGKNTITIKNILVGQVWLASGQSNMAWKVRQAMNANTEIHNAAYPKIRLFSVPRTAAYPPAADCNGRWVECSPQTVSDFSAIAYFFGCYLHKGIKQPIGLINSSWGGTIIETWISMQKLESDQAFVESLRSLNIAIAQSQKNDANTAAKPDPNAPPRIAVPIGPKYRNGASLLYNGMIAPIIPYAIKGVIWYQGESNVRHSILYRKAFASLIADWRTGWQEGDFPFLFVQLANFKTEPSRCQPQQWAQVREAQFKTLELPNTGMAVTTDIGEVNSIHPRNKQEVGRRLALWALAKSYGKNIEYSGPIYKSMKVEDGRFYLTFTHADGLVAKGGELKGFTIAGTDHKFVPAVATIKDETVIVESTDVKQPAAVRYGWSDVTAECNLYNSVGLPGSPFRTDDWPGIPDDLLPER